MKRAIRLCLLLVLIIGPVDAQEFSVVQEREVTPSPGVRLVRLEASSDKATVSGTLIEVGAAGTGSRVEAIAAVSDPWGAHPLEGLLERESARGGITLTGEVGGSEDADGPAFQFLQGTVWSWPSSGPVLTVGPDGLTRLIGIPPAESASIRDGSGSWSLPLGSVNGPAPQGQVSLVCGPMNARSPFLATWPEGTRVVALTPSRGNTLNEASFWDPGIADLHRLWIPDAPIPGSAFSLSRNQWALLVPPSLPEEDQLRIMEANGLLVDIPLGPDVPFSLFAAGAGSWFLRAGAPSATLGEAHAGARTFLAVDSTGGRCWMVMLNSESRGGVTNAQALEILRGRGAWDAVELPGSGTRMAMAPLLVEGWQPLPAAIPARTALLAVNRPVGLLLPGGGNLRKLRILRVDGSPSPSLANPPRAVADGRIGFHGAGDHFWSAPFVRPPAGDSSDVGAWLEAALPPDSTVAMIDLYHADNAGFSRQFNLRSFRVLGRARALGEWEAIFESTHQVSTSRERLRLDPPRPLSQLRIEIVDPGFLPGLETARLAEMIVWGTTRQ